MICDSCKTTYRIGVEVDGTHLRKPTTQHLCFKCGYDLVPTVLKTVKDRAVERLVDNISTQIKALLSLSFLVLILSSCALTIPLTHQPTTPTPTPQCRLIPLIFGPCIDPTETRIQKFYREMEEAKSLYQNKHTPSLQK